MPDERDVRKACGRAREVHVLAYGGRAVDLWWQGVRAKLEQQSRLGVVDVPIEASRALAQLADRSIALQVTIQQGHIDVTDGSTSIPVDAKTLKTLAPDR